MNTPNPATPPVPQPLGRPVRIRKSAGTGGPARTGRPTRSGGGGVVTMAGLPAVVAIVGGLLLTGVLASNAGRGQVLDRYERDATNALIAGDYETARICFERLLQARPNDPGFRNGLQVSQAAVGNAKGGQ